MSTTPTEAKKPGLFSGGASAGVPVTYLVSISFLVRSAWKQVRYYARKIPGNARSHRCRPQRSDTLKDQSQCAALFDARHGWQFQGPRH